jgi:hypothetical protein
VGIPWTEGDIDRPSWERIAAKGRLISSKERTSLPVANSHTEWVDVQYGGYCTPNKLKEYRRDEKQNYLYEFGNKDEETYR